MTVSEQRGVREPPAGAISLRPRLSLPHHNIQQLMERHLLGTVLVQSMYSLYTVLVKSGYCFGYSLGIVLVQSWYMFTE